MWKRVVVGLVGLLVLLYVGDDAIVRFHIPRSRDPMGTVTVSRYYSVMKKNGKPDYYFDPPQAEACVRSLFPHLGYPPCWYLRWNANQEIKI